MDNYNLQQTDAKIQAILNKVQPVVDNNTVAGFGNGYAISTTAGATAAKEVTINGFTPTIDGIFSVLFQNGFTASDPTLNVSNTGAKDLKLFGSALPASFVPDGTILTLTYDGTNYNVVGRLNDITVKSTLESTDAPLLQDANGNFIKSTPAALASLLVKTIKDADPDNPTSTVTWFGWRRPVNSSNPEGEPVGNLLRLARMQTILKLGGYMVKNDHTRKKLSPSDHRFYEEDGAAVVFTGADGHYHWGWGVDMWYSSWIEDGFEYEVFDDREIPGHPCVKIPIGSVSAAGRCGIDRTNLILVDYLSEDARYRGGNNESSWDETYRSLLGMPVTNIAIGTLAGYARKNGSLWFANERVALFIVGALMRVFFHNANIQAAFVEGVDERGLHRGGLGLGVDCESSSWWNTYNSNNPYFKMSLGIEKGDFTGLLSYSIELSDGTTKQINGVPCFMGLKNWYKSLWVMEEDSLLVCNSNKTQSMYVKKVIDGTAPSLSEVSDKVLAATCPAHASASWSAIKQTSKAYLSGAPVVDGGTNETFMCDGYYNPAVTDGSVRGSLRLGSAYNGDNAGSCLLTGSDAPSGADANWGAVLCEFTESFDTELTVPASE